MEIANNVGMMMPSTKGLQQSLGQDIAFTSIENSSTRKGTNALYAMQPNAYYDLGTEIKQARAEKGIGLNLDVSV